MPTRQSNPFQASGSATEPDLRAPTRLRVEHLEEPLGIDFAGPRLSWWLPLGAREQRAYQLRTNDGDSGRVDSERCLLVDFAGPPRRHRCKHGRCATYRATRIGPRLLGHLRCYNNLHTGFGFYSIRVSATGLTQTEHDGLINGFYTDITFMEPYVLASSGEVVDVSNPDAPVRAGKFAFTGPVAPGRSSNEVLMLSNGESVSPPWSSISAPLTLMMLDLETFTARGSSLLDGGSYGAVQHFVRVRSGTYAFVANKGSGSAAVHIFNMPAFTEQ